MLADARVAETLEPQASAVEILRVTSSSPDDLQLCSDGKTLRLVAHHASLPAKPAVGQFTLPLVGGTVAGRVVLERRMIHVRDLQKEVDDFPEGSAFARQFGHRTILVVPLLREGVSIGCIQIRRAEVQPFTEKQVELLKTFADQAVIAIENVRLFIEAPGRRHPILQARSRPSRLMIQIPDIIVANRSHAIPAEPAARSELDSPNAHVDRPQRANASQRSDRT